jgi:hypothetical protein
MGGTADDALQEEALDLIFEETNLDHAAVERQLERLRTRS